MIDTARIKQPAKPTKEQNADTNSTFDSVFNKWQGDRYWMTSFCHKSAHKSVLTNHPKKSDRAIKVRNFINGTIHQFH